MEIINIGIAGLGTVGSEVAKQLQSNSEFLNRKAGKQLNLVAVSANNKNKNRNFDLSNLKWFTNAALMSETNEIDLVVELIGGSDGIALDLCKNSLIKGKSVVTANKAMMSKHGYELAKISEKNKKLILLDILKDRCSTYVLELIYVIIEKGDIKSLSAIINRFFVFVSNEADIIPVRIITPSALDNNTNKDLIEKIESKLNKKVNVKNEVDPKIIGGVKLMIGNKVIDGSVSHQLRKIKNALEQV